MTTDQPHTPDGGDRPEKAAAVARHRLDTSRSPARRIVAGLASVAMTAAVAGTVLVSGAAPASAAATRQGVVGRAAHYGLSRGYHVGVAVLDTRTGRLYSAGGHDHTFASESVVKVMIAARLFAQGRMHGSTKSRAYKMITQSDDSIASAFYGSVGGDSLINWVKRHYHVPSLGSPPHRSNWWGNTHITPDGLVRLYAKLKADKTVGPWLLNAMHDAHKYGSDGFYQWFGLHEANPHAAIKQGWGTDYDDWSRSADENTTGYVDGDRYAVAILARGPVGTYGRQIGTMLTRTARILLPGGHFPSGVPGITQLSRTTGRTAGGTSLTVWGHDFDHATAVWFSGRKGRKMHVVSPSKITVVAPPHAHGVKTVRVATTHGMSSAPGAKFTYVAPPNVVSISPSSGSAGQTVTVQGHNFTKLERVSFGTSAVRNFQVVSSRTLRVTVPSHAPGGAHVRVVTGYGWSQAVAADVFTYPAPGPATTAPSQTGSAGKTLH